MTNETKNHKITRRIEVEVPHEGGRITFVYPMKGPGTFANVQKQIESDGLVAPTMAQTASLIYTAYENQNEPEFNETILRFYNNFLWGFNGILYVPNKGTYIQDNPQTKNGRVLLDESELVKKLESGDKSVRFVPFGYKTDVQNAFELEEENSFVIALAGEEGAEKLAKLSEKIAKLSGNYPSKPLINRFKNVNVNNEIVGVPILGGFCYCWLNVIGDYYYDNDGYASGVCKTSASQDAKSEKK